MWRSLVAAVTRNHHIMLPSQRRMRRYRASVIQLVHKPSNFNYELAPAGHDPAHMTLLLQQRTIFTPYRPVVSHQALVVTSLHWKASSLFNLQANLRIG